MSAPVVLVTRTSPGAERTANAVRARGAEPLVRPMLEAAAVEFDLKVLNEGQAVAVTSGHAVRAVPAEMWARARPVFAVGEATAEAARAAGAKDVRSAAGGAGALAALVAESLDPAAGPVAFPRGREVAGDLESRLKRAGFEVAPAIVYETRPVDGLESDLRARFDMGRVDAVLFHSRRGAEAFAAAGGGLDLGSVTAAALSAEVAAGLQGLRFQSVAVAAEPNENGLLDALFAALASRS